MKRDNRQEQHYQQQPARRRNRRYLHWAAGLALLLGVVNAALSLTAQSRESGNIEVVATIPPVADIIQELGGERVTVHSLLPAGASPHTFEPRPSDVRRIATADLIVTVGEGLDVWVEKLLTAAGSSKTTRLAITSATRLLPARTNRILVTSTPESGHTDAEHSHDHDDEGMYDPHVWLDPVRVRDDIAPAIVASLAKVDPAGRSYYQSRLKLYQAKLTELDQELNRLLQPYRGFRFIAFHSAWRYMAERYGLEEAAAIEPFPGREPSPAWLAELQKLAKAQSACIIVAEVQFNPQIARMLSQAINGVVVTLDPLGGPDVTGRSTYLELMRYNATELAKAARQVRAERADGK
ncbi:MAG TPA: zinc ABC transporter substrate-binding protein [Firmicutes bacterium]|nr:zinc ABC transporter substrate-binding protein [Bacillota bacterium]